MLKKISLAVIPAVLSSCIAYHKLADHETVANKVTAGYVASTLKDESYPDNFRQGVQVAGKTYTRTTSDKKSPRYEDNYVSSEISGNFLFREGDAPFFEFGLTESRGIYSKNTDWGLEFRLGLLRAALLDHDIFFTPEIGVGLEVPTPYDYLGLRAGYTFGLLAGEEKGKFMYTYRHQLMLGFSFTD